MTPPAEQERRFSQAMHADSQGPAGAESRSSTAEMVRARTLVGRSWGGIHPERWRVIQELDPQGTFLDVGCSTGDYVTRLRAEGRRAWGSDLLHQESWAAPYFFQSDARDLPLRTDSVDFVIAFEVLEHLPDPASYLREFKRVARRKLVLSVPNCSVPEAMRRAGVTFHHWVDPTHRNFFTRETLSEVLAAAGFTLDSMELINPIRPELLLFSTWGVQGRAAGTLARWLEGIPWRRKHNMTILATASV